ncbi:polysaccharide deacetylase family protein [Thermospira aquatica]|uniref:Polysaccharide deacetylase family protein n=1 Tax=Thermospira aquatica TaxID=2828656 RepID=A0AAX3BH45_9SPIR|nr:polysaccharide deacetylase family protein [Thermospira aquatica]URA11303.1 polysaccharide deacetylase family protein [Thermospira aquatica]
MQKYMWFLSLMGLLHAEECSLLILCYHTFSPHLQSPYNFSPDTFSNHILTIQKAWYRFVSWQDVTNNTLTGTKNILITIDDGNTSVRTIEALLDEMGIKPILFIYPAIIGKVPYALTWEDLDRMKAKGWTIGAHGYNHLFINQQLYENDRKAFYREIRYSKQVLEKKTSENIILFGFPFGVYSPLTIEPLRQEGYRYAFTIVRKPALWPPSDPYRIPRYLMTPSMWNHLAKLLTNTNHIALKE